MKTLEQRLREFRVEAKREGMTFRRNVMSCCRSCAEVETNGNDVVVWSFGGQGGYISIRGNEAYHNDRSYGFPNVIYQDQIYFNHEGLIEGEKWTVRGEKFLELAEKHGLHFFQEFTSQHRVIILDIEKSIEAVDLVA